MDALEGVTVNANKQAGGMYSLDSEVTFVLVKLF
jgi:hypothetical protein